VRKNPFPSQNWYSADWLASEAKATMTLEQQGAYRNLLDHAWIQDPPCTLPDDDAVLAGLSGAGAKWEEMASVVRRWFTAKRGRLVNEKQLTTYREMESRREAKSTAGKLGNVKRWKSQEKDASQSDRDAITGASPPVPVPVPVPKEDLSLFARAMGEYPKRAGANPEDPALEAWRARLREGVSAEDLASAVQRYHRFCEATGIIGTELVQQASNFFGKKAGWREKWEIPKVPPAVAKVNGHRPRKLRLVDGRVIDADPKRVRFIDAPDAPAHYVLPDGTITVRKGAAWVTEQEAIAR
jgi:uncharacterized protein YdaU (DUF1376 family)